LVALFRFWSDHFIPARFLHIRAGGARLLHARCVPVRRGEAQPGDTSGEGHRTALRPPLPAGIEAEPFDSAREIDYN